MTATMRPSLARSWFMVAVLLAANILSFVDRMLISLLIEPIRASFQLSDVQASLLLGLSFALLYSVLGLPLGWLADRGNRRNLVIGGVVIWSLATAGCGLAGSFLALFAMRVAVGAGEAILSPSAYSLIGDSFPRDRLARAIGVFSLGVPIGSGVALMVGSLLISMGPGPFGALLGSLSLTDSWRPSFLWVTLPAIAVILAMLTVREPVRRTTPADAGSAAGLGRFLRENAAAIGSHLVGNALITATFYGMVAWTPAFLVRTYGLSLPQAGLSFGVVSALCGATGVLCGGWLADSWFARGRADGHMRAIRLAAIIGGPFLVVAMLMPSATLALTFIAIAFFFLVFQGVAGAALQLISPNRFRARMTAIYFFVANMFGLGLGPTAIALLTDHLFGDPAALRYSIALAACVFLPAGALVLTLGLPAFRRAIDRATE